MSLDPEMELWRKGWTSSEPSTAADADALRDQATRQETRMRRLLTAELAATSLFLPFSVVVAWLSRSFEMTLWAVVIWILTISMTAITVWNWQTLWKDSVNSVHDFTVISRKRANAALRSVTLGFWFIAVNVAISTAWYGIDLGLHRIGIRRFCLGMALITLISAIFVFILNRRRTKAQDDLAQIGLVTE